MSVFPQTHVHQDFPQYVPLVFRDPSQFDLYAFPPLLQQLGNYIPCKILICVTMYNEDSFALQQTLKAICINADKLQVAGLLSSNVGVVLIQDGIDKLHPKMDDFGKSLNLFNTELIKKNQQDTFHCFASKLTYAKSPTEFYPPIHLITGIKQSNKGKLDSHRWFFKCICQHVDPKYCVLIDCGTIPQDDAIFYLIEELETKEDVGGTCGEIRVQDPMYCHLIETAQDIEYRVYHFMDKSLESLFGYVTVLPGAFSAYRWKHLNGEPLDEHYFYAFREDAEMDCYKANMYLAEDRVLGTAILLRPFHKNVLSYVRKAIAHTDVPRNFSSIMQQRRRWINGALFAMVHSFKAIFSLKDTKHSCCKKWWLMFFMLYNSLGFFITYFAPAVLFLYIHYIFNISFGSMEEMNSFSVGLKVTYGLVVFLNIVTSLGNKPTSYPRLYVTCAAVLGMIMVFVLGLTLLQVYKGKVTVVVAGFLGLLISLMLICSLIHKQFLALLKGSFQFLFMLPCYINVYLIYAFCNVHDVTWGLKNDKESKM